MEYFSIKTKRELLEQGQLRLFDNLEVGKCGAIDVGDLSVEVCKIDEETAEIRVKPKL